MSGWTTVQFPQAPDLDTRKAIIRWAEETLPGKFIPLHQRDAMGRRSFGFDFQRPDDATAFRMRWMAETPDPRTAAAETCVA